MADSTDDALCDAYTDGILGPISDAPSVHVQGLRAVAAQVRAQIAEDIEADKTYDVPSRAHFARIARGDA